MGAALLGGLLDGGWEADELAIAEVDAERRRELEQQFPKVRVVPSPAWAVADADVVVVAVKPGDVAPSSAGVPSRRCGSTRSCCRSRPASRSRRSKRSRRVDRSCARCRTRPRSSGLGASAIAAGRHADDRTRPGGAAARRGRHRRDASPSRRSTRSPVSRAPGPAYVFLVAEAMIEAGVLVGLPRDVAEQLVVQTLLGSATLLAQSDDGPEALRAAVTSPGGTTAAGLRELEAHGVRAAILDAVSRRRPAAPASSASESQA